MGIVSDKRITNCTDRMGNAMMLLFRTVGTYSAGTETKPQINQDAVRIMKKLYGIDMETNGQYSKLITDIPDVDIAISMGCNVGCPFIGRPFDDNWGLDDPTGKDDVDFIKVIREIEEKIIKLKNSL